eukprot:3353343-Pyramimonas_sp.AAC.1
MSASAHQATRSSRRTTSFATGPPLNQPVLIGRRPGASRRTTCSSWLQRRPRATPSLAHGSKMGR